ncbi:MAG: hypothetical protein PHS07_02880 [Patescibacteria group bacterium]|nr:hypothetical protein [Patescibacteria group bacterium]
MLKQVQHDTLDVCHCEEEFANSANDACPPQAGGNLTSEVSLRGGGNPTTWQSRKSTH